MADNKLYCTQLYMNGNPFLIYDEEAHEEITQLRLNLEGAQSTINDLIKKTENLTDESVYTGDIPWNTWGSIYDVDNQPTETEDKFKGSEIPYFEMQKKDPTVLYIRLH